MQNKFQAGDFLVSVHPETQKLVFLCKVLKDTNWCSIVADEFGPTIGYGTQRIYDYDRLATEDEINQFLRPL